MNPWRTLLLTLALLTALRIALVAFEKPSAEEAYFFLCSQQPAPAYFDGPPGTAWVVAGLHSLGGPDWIWRSSAPLWALAASIACFLLIRKQASEAEALLGTLILNLVPAFNTSALRVGPWLPALAFLLLGLLCARVAFDKEKNALRWWIAGGLCIGAASLFSYWSASLIIAVWLFVLCSPRHRQARDFPGLILFAALPAAMLIPALRWNAALQWIPIAGGTLKTLWQFDLGGFALSLQASLYLLSPLILPGLFWAWLASSRGMRIHRQPRFLFLAALPAMASGCYALLRGMDAVFFFLAATPLLIVKALSLCNSLRLGKWLAGLAAAIAALLSLHASALVLAESRHWSAAASGTREAFLEKLSEGQDNLFLIAQDAPLASILGYYFKEELIPPPGHPVVYARESQDVSNQFGIWPGYDDFVETSRPSDEIFTEQKGENPFIGRNALYITRESANDLPQSVKGAFESVSLLKALYPDGEAKEPLYIYLCVNYQTLPL